MQSASLRFGADWIRIARGHRQRGRFRCRFDLVHLVGADAAISMHAFPCLHSHSLISFGTRAWNIHRSMRRLLCRFELRVPVRRLSEDARQYPVDGESGRRVVRGQPLVVLEVVGGGDKEPRHLCVAARIASCIGSCIGSCVAACIAACTAACKAHSSRATLQ